MAVTCFFVLLFVGVHPLLATTCAPGAQVTCAFRVPTKDNQFHHKLF